MSQNRTFLKSRNIKKVDNFDYVKFVMLILGARSVISSSRHLPERLRQMLTRRPTNVVAVAPANKMARTIWALLAYDIWQIAGARYIRKASKLRVEFALGVRYQIPISRFPQFAALDRKPAARDLKALKVSPKGRSVRFPRLGVKVRIADVRQAKCGVRSAAASHNCHVNVTISILTRFAR